MEHKYNYRKYSKTQEIITLIKLQNETIKYFTDK